jgi:hypothetical protein
MSNSRNASAMMNEEVCWFNIDIAKRHLLLQKVWQNPEKTQRIRKKREFEK